MSISRSAVLAAKRSFLNFWAPPPMDGAELLLADFRLQHWGKTGTVRKWRETLRVLVEGRVAGESLFRADGERIGLGS